MEDAWLQCVPEYIVQEGLLVVNDSSAAAREVAIFEAFSLAFGKGRLGWLGIDAFRLWYARARRLSSLRSRVELHTFLVAVTPESVKKKREVKRQADATKKRNLLLALVGQCEQVRDSNAALINSSVKSRKAVTAVRALTSPRSEETGSRSTMRGPYGVRIPAILPSNGTAARQMEAIAQAVDDMYMEDHELLVQYAPLEKVLTKMLKSSAVPRGTDTLYHLIIADHLDALKVTSKSKRSPCSLWGLNPLLWPETAVSAMVRWFDFEGGVHRLKEMNQWRVAELNRVLNQVITVDGVHVKVILWYAVGDNERLQVEAGGNTGSSACRCPFCFLPADLFEMLPRHGHRRSVQSGADMWARLEEAQRRVEGLASLGNMNVKVVASLASHARKMHGSQSSAPLLSIGATFSLGAVRFSLPILHDVAQILLSLKRFLNPLLPEENRLPIKEYVSCAERRIEFSTWREVYASLEPCWFWVCDLASQMCATLWASTPVTAVGALRAQLCGLLFHFLIASARPEDVSSNYFHGIAAHLLDFLVPLVKLGLPALPLFEEAGERETTVIREFVRSHSNFKDNLFRGARVFEELKGLSRGTAIRQRRVLTDATPFSNIAIAPCIVGASPFHLESLQQLLRDIGNIPQLACHFAGVSESWLVFATGDTPTDWNEVSLVCVCGEHTFDPAETTFANVDAEHLAQAWSVDIAPSSLAPVRHADLKLMVESPLGLPPLFDVPLVLQEALQAPPLSGLLRADLVAKSAPELRGLCRERNLSTSGKKADLVERLTGMPDVVDPNEQHASEAAFNLETLSVPQLRMLCTAHGLTPEKRKSDLVNQVGALDLSVNAINSILAGHVDSRKRQDRDVAEKESDGEDELVGCLDETGPLSGGGDELEAQASAEGTTHAALARGVKFRFVLRRITE